MQERPSSQIPIRVGPTIDGRCAGVAEQSGGVVRQKDPELKNVVEQLARGEVGEAVQGLERQGRVHEVKDPAQRIEAIAKEYAKSPENTLVVSPDNRSRAQINAKIHTELQAKGVVGREEHRIDTLVPRQDLTGADRTWAQRYERDNVLLYSRSSKETGIDKGEYARVKHIEADKNLLTVVRADGSERTYDPHRQQGVSVYRDQEKAFSSVSASSRPGRCGSKASAWI